MALRDFIRMLRRGAVLIILTLLVGVGAAAAFSLLQTPEYEASTKMYVAQSSSSNVQDLQQGNNFITQAVKSYADVVTTRAVLQPVIDQFGLDVSSRELAESVRASAPLDTTIIDITVKDQSRQDAATLADAIGESLKTVVGTLVPETIEGTPQVQITQLEQAEIPESPSSPNLPVNIIVGALIGLLIGVGVSLLRETLDNRIRGERDVELVTT